MSNPTTSLDFSRKLFEIIGEKNKEKTENYWFSFTENGKKEVWCVNTETECEIMNWDFDDWLPAYTFGELLRIIPLIAEKKGWNTNGTHEREMEIVENLALKYTYAYPNTPEQGMQAVENYLEQYL